MNVKLFSTGTVSGRAAALAHAIQTTTGHDTNRCVAIVSALFFGHHPKQSPIWLTIKDAQSISLLESEARNCNLALEIVD
jgi:hypothetical protein